MLQCVRQSIFRSYREELIESTGESSSDMVTLLTIHVQER